MLNQSDDLNHEQIIKLTTEYVKGELSNAEGGHDWYHIQRVWKNSLYIAKQENKGDVLIIELSALLHDIADAKFHDGDETIGPRKAGEFLRSLNLHKEVIDHVIKIVENISFRKRLSNSNFTSDELKIVQDADRLDALGAIGIARVFNFGGYKNRPIYEPMTVNGKINLIGQTLEERRHTIGHFYDKLLLLNKMMNTQSGRKIAEERHAFMVQYLDQFYKEWDGLG